MLASTKARGSRHDKKYRLVGRKVVECASLMEWASMFERENRRVAMTDIGPYRVSTVFLGLDHQYGDGPPLLFETMVFGPYTTEKNEVFEKHELDCARYSTYEEAEQGHEKVVQMVREGKYD